MEKALEIKRSITFTLEKRKSDEGVLITENVPIRASISFSGKRIILPIGYRCDFSKWDDKKQKVKNNTTNQKKQSSTDINNRIERIAVSLNEFFKACEVQRRMPTDDDVKKAVKSISIEQKGIDKDEDFYSDFNEFIQLKARERSWSENTIDRYNIAFMRFREFAPKITYSTFNTDTFLSFIQYYRKEKGARNTTIDKVLEYIRSFLKYAFEQGKAIDVKLLTYKPKLKGTGSETPKKVIFLTKDELSKLKACVIPESKKYLERIKDVFLFGCFCGLRYSDLYNLKKTDIVNGKINIVTKKTTQELSIELNDITRGILEKYNEVPLPNGKALPVISNQKYNDYLKELGQLAQLDQMETIVYFKGNQRIEEVFPKWQLISSHSARKSFITNLIYLGVSDNIIKEWSGHSSNKSFERYHKIIDEIKSKEMNKLDGLI